MPSGVTLANSFYCSLIYHFLYCHALIGYFTQICPVDVILNIFSICLQFHCYLIDSLLMYLGEFLISLNIFRSTFLFRFSLCSFGDLHGSWSYLYTKMHSV
jgi:hypothetical protein